MRSGFCLGLGSWPNALTKVLFGLRDCHVHAVGADVETNAHVGIYQGSSFCLLDDVNGCERLQYAALDPVHVDGFQSLAEDLWLAWEAVQKRSELRGCRCHGCLSLACQLRSAHWRTPSTPFTKRSPSRCSVFTCQGLGIQSERHAGRVHPGPSLGCRRP